MISKRRILGFVAFLVALGLSVYQLMLNPTKNWYWGVVAVALFVMVVASVYLIKQDLDRFHPKIKSGSKNKKK
jgi:uncharacterized membrane protein